MEPEVLRYDLVKYLGEYQGYKRIYVARQRGGKDSLCLLHIYYNPTLNSEQILANLSRYVQYMQDVRLTSHPNVLQIYRVGDMLPDRSGRTILLHSHVVTGGALCLVTEYIEGVSLSRKFSPMTTGLFENWVILYSHQICAALAFAHAVSLCNEHLDPAFMLVTDSQQLKITNFGIAVSIANFEVSELSESPTKVIIEWPLYASPEQIKGELVSSATDIFSVGVIMYQLATNRHPFRYLLPSKSNLGDYYDAVLNRSPVLPRLLNPSLSGHMEDVILSALDKEPRNRPSAADILRSFPSVTAR